MSLQGILQLHLGMIGAEDDLTENDICINQYISSMLKSVDILICLIMYISLFFRH